MLYLMNKLQSFVAAHPREEGQGMVEYTLIIGTISLVIVAAFLTTGIEQSIKDLASHIATSISG
jgi:Flp pilus assembly pilin Flp